jgi:hypothetical protein
MNLLDRQRNEHNFDKASTKLEKTFCSQCCVLCNGSNVSNFKGNNLNNNFIRRSSTEDANDQQQQESKDVNSESRGQRNSKLL